MLKQELKELFNVVEKTPWKDNTPFDVIFEIAQNEFEKIKTNLTRKPVLIRLCGQSGSGKTTQLLPSIMFALEQQKNRAALLAVRNFAALYPSYSNLKQTCAAGQLREATNGFALKCLFATLFLLAQEGFEIVYDVTVLEPKIEEKLLKMVKRNGYTQVFNILAVSPAQSEIFIEKRKQDQKNPEFGRQILASSKQYFNNNLEKGLEFLSKKTPNSTAVVWTAYSTLPSYVGNLGNCVGVVKHLRTQTQTSTFSENKLKNTKKKFYLNFFS